ncbi:phage tail assembly protein [Tepidanaerobacter acetatoxydans]|uniref:phage tail assembly protein n=1 Tax=Tepidanaerobacter acetatoxydans TaxID=499229 RepID=UPI0026EF6126|nr:phage tail assembly protein [Tepidanaerobacter acetatoxydans]
MAKENKELIENKEIMEELEEELDINKYTFSKPIKFEGEEYKEIILNLEGLTGKDIKEVSNELVLKGEIMGLAETNKNFLAALAARSAGLPIEFMDYIPAKDFSKITILVQNFLLG